tara:strand:+ start:545 stop:847 length:303 start_codon:yes stop_codon:yes gene_type:complete
MRRTASEVLRQLENRIARLEHTADEVKIKKSKNIPLLQALLEELGVDIDAVYQLTETDNTVSVLLKKAVKGKKDWSITKWATNEAKIITSKGNHYLISAN